MSNSTDDRKQSLWENRRVRIAAYISAAVALVVVIALVVFFVRKDSADTPPPVDVPSSFEQPKPEQYEKPTDLPEAPGEEDEDQGSVENDDGSEVGPPIQEKSSEEEAARKAAESAIVEWGKQDSQEEPKKRIKRMEKITTKTSTIPEDAPLFIDSWHEGGEEGDDHDHGDEGTTASTVEIDAMSFDRSNGSTQATYNVALVVTVHEEFMGEKFDRAPYDFKASITMKKQGKDWKADMIVPAAY